MAVKTITIDLEAYHLLLLIGTAALIDDAPLVTKNVKDFRRVPGLRVISY